MEDFSLDDLALRTGFDRRVIRSFIEQGLLRGPDTLGRYARYSPGHLVRLLAIKALKEIRGLQLSEIRRMLIVMTDEEMSSLASLGEPEFAISTPCESALEYILSLNHPSTLDQGSSQEERIKYFVDLKDLERNQQFGSIDDRADVQRLAHTALPACSPAGEAMPSVEAVSGTNATFGNADIPNSVHQSNNPTTNNGKNWQPAGTDDGVIKASTSAPLASCEAGATTSPESIDNTEGPEILSKIELEVHPAEHPVLEPGNHHPASSGTPVLFGNLTSPADSTTATRQSFKVSRVSSGFQSFTIQSTTGNTPIDQLLNELTKIVDSSRMRKQSRGESWYRIGVTPDIELSVRGIINPEQLTRLERIADCLREILMGGPN